MKTAWKGASFWVILLVCWIQSGLFASSISRPYYDISIFRTAQAGSPAVLVIALKPNVQKALVHLDPKTDALVAELEFVIEAREPRNGQVRHSWHFRHHFQQGINFDEGLLGRFPLSLDPGRFEIHVELIDRFGGARYFEKLPYEQRPIHQRLSMSDIEMETIKSFGPVSLKQPLIGLRVENQPDSLRYWVDIDAKKPSKLTLRSVLYRMQERSDQVGGAFGAADTRLFRTFLQETDIMQLTAGTNRFSTSFPLQDAMDGTYHVELSIYEGDSMIAQASRFVVLEWPRLKDIFEDLDRAITWMKWVAPPSDILRLKSQTAGDEKLRQFQAWWIKRAEPADVDGHRAMKNYYSRILLAIETLKDDKLGWKSDRARTMVWFGQPEMEASFPFSDGNWLIWTYKKYNLAFLFREMGGTWKLWYT